MNNIETDMEKERNIKTAVELECDEEAVVVEIRGGPGLVSRLAAMGIAEGSRIRMLRTAAAGPLIVQAGESRIVLGRGEAARILVERSESEKSTEKRHFLVALAGQPNVGKSTVFNILTGLSQHVGNWPGKTVEKKTGVHISQDAVLEVVDLPGTYSLTALSEEERAARDFILTERPDVIVLLANAAALERSLYLLSELLLLERPVILAVNMVDVAEGQGIHIDARTVQEVIGIPVIPMVATKNRGMRELISAIVSLACSCERPKPRLPSVTEDHADVFKDLRLIIESHPVDSMPVAWTVTKLMEGDSEITEKVKAYVSPDVWNKIEGILRSHEDSLHAVVGGRYDWIEKITRASISHFKMGQMVITDKIDHILTRPIIGIPALLVALGIVFLCTYAVGFPLQAALQSAISSCGSRLAPIFEDAPYWIEGILIEGILGGVGSVVSFVPILAIFFAAMAILEDVGYMARAAFVMDRFMHLIGLHGKSFMPLCLGFGCNVPAILGARIVESRKKKILTTFLSPFVPCSARLGVLTIVSAAVFGKNAALISVSLVAANFAILALVGTILSKSALRDDPTPFIMELPLYHKPNARTIVAAVWSRTLTFLQRAGTIIVLVSIGLWILSHLPTGEVETSVLSRLGKAVEPIGAPLGLDWRTITALLAGIVAKENSIAALGVLYEAGEKGLDSVLPQALPPASALSFLAALMLFVPCAATAAVMYREMENRLWFFASILVMAAISFLGGLLAYRIGLSIF